MISKDNIITIVLIIVAIAFLKMCEKDNYVFPVSNQKTIETRIKGKETIIRTHTIASDNGKKIINSLNGRVDELMVELNILKGIRDTFNIVPIQDTLIHVLYQQGRIKDGVIRNQDTIILAQRFIINSKDTIIALKDIDIKKIKRQRNWSFLANGLLTGLLIIK